MNGIRLKTIFIFTMVALFIVACTKEKDDSNGWSSCFDCTLDSWTGSFTGKTSFYNAVNNSTEEELDITIEVMETGTNYLTISVQVPNHYSANVSGELLSGYSVSFAGSSNSFSATLYKKDDQLQLVGNAKRFHYKVDSLIIERVINFETLKVMTK
ncbi:MAG: hypothetical protein KQI35_11245 [Bacteroidetes bacterium]|nr:hypothetical protein [Bacteroidota bacterium]